MMKTDFVTILQHYKLFSNGKWFSLRTHKFLKPFVNSSGYERVDLYVNGERKRVFTHIKVVEYFGDCKGHRLPANNGTLRELGISIDHIDRNKHHNNIENLELVTHKENCRRKYAT